MEPFTPWDALVKFFARKMEPMAGKGTSLCALDASQGAFSANLGLDPEIIKQDLLGKIVRMGIFFE